MLRDKESIKRAALIAAGIRRRVLRHTILNGGGYLSQACSSAEILAALYQNILNIGPNEGDKLPGPFLGVPGPDQPDAATGGHYNGPKGPELDRFVFSPVHYALVLYAALIETGRLDEGALEQFNLDGSTVELIGAEHSPGHEVTAGSLAQALSQAAGIAMGRKLRGDTGRVWVFISDGEMQEGQTYEALAAASYHRLENLCVVMDANAQQCDGAMDAVMDIEPLSARLTSFGAAAVEVDGHDIEALCRAARTEHPGKPLVIIARTDPCRGIDLLVERAPRLHYVRFKSGEERQRYEDFLNALDRAAGEEPGR